MRKLIVTLVVGLSTMFTGLTQGQGPPPCDSWARACVVWGCGAGPGDLYPMQFCMTFPALRRVQECRLDRPLEIVNMGNPPPTHRVGPWKLMCVHNDGTEWHTNQCGWYWIGENWGGPCNILVRGCAGTTAEPC